MSVDVTTGRGKLKTEVTIKGKTKVASVRVGRPIKKVAPDAQRHIDQLAGVDLTNATDGSVLVYNSSSENFEATKRLEKQFINGGNF